MITAFRNKVLFTFHYVSIKSIYCPIDKVVFIYLHSTMYLLNPIQSRLRRSIKSRFTFHYVSIKSQTFTVFFSDVKNLHSTMYLLNRVNLFSSIGVTQFTFHYVSIKSN